MEPINRRSVIVTTTAGCAGLVAGCLGNDSPRYEEDANLSIDANDFDLDNDWEEATGEDANPHWEQTFFSEDESRALLYDYEIHEDVADAEERYEQSASDRGEHAEDWDVGDQSYILEDDDLASVFWRDSNAIGQVGAVTMPGGGDRTRATQYGRAIHENWSE